jgi:hypothetical protein
MEGYIYRTIGLLGEISIFKIGGAEKEVVTNKGLNSTPIRVNDLQQSYVHINYIKCSVSRYKQRAMYFSDS